MTVHSDSDFGNFRRRPVFGSRRVSVVFHTHRPMYFWFFKIRDTVAGDHPLAVRNRPGTPSSFRCLTIPDCAAPSANSLNIRSTMVPSRGSTSMP